MRAFPAYAGMFLYRRRSHDDRRSFPRVCGDVSDASSSPLARLRLSPRMRGCFHFGVCWLVSGDAFPAYAGMFLPVRLFGRPLRRFPRVCGDVSKEIYAQGTADELSPRMRGCFSASVFSDSFDSSFPRVCGDVSRRRAVVRLHFGLSPRMRGCFLLLLRSDSRILAFPAYAGMFPITPMTASPSVAFPAYAGMFPVSGVYPCANRCFPRVCGDVSSHDAYRDEPNWLSPRMRGCFQVHCQQHQNLQAFPAYAGMFPIPLAVACV